MNLRLTYDCFSGAAEDMAHSSLRFGMGRFTTEAEIDFVTEKIVATVNRLRDMRCVSTAEPYILLTFKTARYGKWFKKE